MAKAESYACDGGCGAQLTIDPADSVWKHGWYLVYRLGPTVHACSAICLTRAVAPEAEVEQRRLTVRQG